MESLSLKVIAPLLRVSKSTVILKGVPSSSFLAYRLPIETLEESTLLAIPRALRRLASDLTAGRKAGLFERGTRRTLVGATRIGNDRTFHMLADFN